MLKKIAIAVVAVIVVGAGVICAMAATKPDVFRVERSATINAPAEKIYPFINNFHEGNNGLHTKSSILI